VGKRANSTDSDPNAAKPTDFDKFTNFMRRLVAVPHSEIKAQLDAEREAKRASRDSASSSKGR
jgi:hypothetical protein